MRKAFGRPLPQSWGHTGDWRLRTVETYPYLTFQKVERGSKGKRSEQTGECRRGGRANTAATCLSDATQTTSWGRKGKECIFRLQSPFDQSFVPHSRKSSRFQADHAWAGLQSSGHLMPQCQQGCLRIIVRGATVRRHLHTASKSPHSANQSSGWKKC